MKGYKVAGLYLAYMLAIALGTASCAAKKNYVVSERKVLDSVIVRVETVKAPLLTQSVIIEQVCDSSEVVGDDGKVYKAPPKFRDFSYQIQIDSLEAEVRFRKNNFSLYIDQVARVIRQKDSIISLREKELAHFEQKVDVRTNWKLVWWAAVAGFVIGALLMWLRPWEGIIKRLL